MRSGTVVKLYYSVVGFVEKDDVYILQSWSSFFHPNVSPPPAKPNFSLGFIISELACRVIYWPCIPKVCWCWCRDSNATGLKETYINRYYISPLFIFEKLNTPYLLSPFLGVKDVGRALSILGLVWILDVFTNVNILLCIGKQPDVAKWRVSIQYVWTYASFIVLNCGQIMIQIDYNDRPNAELIMKSKKNADLIVKSVDLSRWSGPRRGEK